MQPNSIHAPTLNGFPASGDNFTTAASLNDVPDPMALLEALDFLNDCAVALAAFEQDKCTGTPSDD